MKVNKWTMGLAAVGLVSLSSVAQAEEKMTPVLTALSSTTLSGYVSTSAIWRPGNSVVTPGRLFDGNYAFGSHINKQDGFNLDVVSLTLDKPLDEGQWSAGYHVQALIGPDATLRGTGQMGPFGTGNNDIALNEAYVALRVPVGNGLDFKMGQFGTFIGYEAFDSYKNPNYSRSYGFFLEPSSHVGVTASYVFNEIVSAMVGVGNASSTPINAKAALSSNKYYLAMVTLTAPESTGFLKGSTLTFGYQNGAGDAVLNGGSNVHTVNYYVGGTIATPLAGLSLGAALDYISDAGGGANYAKTIAAYASYQATEKLKLNARADWAEGNTFMFGTTNPFASHDELIAFTLTTDYQLWQNVVTRGEVRWDHDLTGGGSIGGYRNSLTLALNVIYKF
jgi:hypothetical protein